MDKYDLIYLYEDTFKKKLRNLKKYNMFAYKKLLLEYYPKLREGELLGGKIDFNKENSIIDYELELPTDKLFAKVHGKIILHYTVYTEKKAIFLTNITPDEIFDGDSKDELLATYKGVMISKNHPEKDMFKIDLLNMLRK